MKSLLFLTVVTLCWPAAAQVRKAHPQDAAFEAAAINASNEPRGIGSNARGSAVVRAQILLDRAHFSCGEIDGNYGSNLEKTVAAFERARDLPVDSRVGPETWAALNADQAPALLTYTIAPEDVAGPFVTVPADLEEQAKLPHLGFASPLEGLGEKFHASPDLLKALNPDSSFDKAGELILAPNVTSAPPGQAASVVVSKSDSSVTALDADGKILSYYVATIGSEHDPLPLGDWKIKGVYHNPIFHYDPTLFWNANPADEKAEIKPGPRNPVGVVWMDLSKEHYGIHGTPAPGKVGHAESHGCIRLTNWDAFELSQMVKAGTPVILKE
ncbi:MAG TPA: L,D-transpeptidase [Bryobacteraceae bacterium]|jgi:lipoprotein-anchoring transpeptidase ErfK/SrfK|nr:L,D-transpeptidase [Bryobacteraceae bacterium]